MPPIIEIIIPKIPTPIITSEGPDGAIVGVGVVTIGGTGVGVAGAVVGVGIAVGTSVGTGVEAGPVGCTGVGRTGVGVATTPCTSHSKEWVPAGPFPQLFTEDTSH